MTTMLSTDIHSTAELISIALAAEREAIRRYTDLAREMHEYGNEEVGALFERMIDEEQEHERLLSEWAELAGITISTDIGPIRWQDPGVATIYDSDAVDPDQSIPYKALAFAVHNEERAFRYYSYVAANSKNPDVQSYAETLAREELGHAALLRAQRRHAWHVQRSKHETEPSIAPGTIYSMPDLLAATACIEECMADLIEVAIKEYPDLEAMAANTRAMLSTTEKALHEGDAPGVEVITTLKSIASWRTRKLAPVEDTPDALQRLSMACDRSFSFYDSVMVSAQDESVMLMAQRLSSHALDRISELRRLTARSRENADQHALS